MLQFYFDFFIEICSIKAKKRHWCVCLVHGEKLFSVWRLLLRKKYFYKFEEVIDEALSEHIGSKRFENPLITLL